MDREIRVDTLNLSPEGGDDLRYVIFYPICKYQEDETFLKPMILELMTIYPSTPFRVKHREGWYHLTFSIKDPVDIHSYVKGMSIISDLNTLFHKYQIAYG